MADQRIQLYSDPKELSGFLNSAGQTIKAALPAHLKVERMIRLAVTAFSTSPQVRQSTPTSILSSLIVAAQLGLEPGVQGQGYFVPYYSSKLGAYICTFIPGWQGLVGLLNNTGRATAWTGAVFEGDEFEFELGSKPTLRHIPNGRHSGDPEKLTWVYACGQVNGSQLPVVDAWPMHRVYKHRDRFNKVGEKHYSFQHPEMYGRKVVLLQVLKYMPRSIELNNAMLVSDATEMGRNPVITEGVVVDLDDEGALPEGNVGKKAEDGKPKSTAEKTKPAEKPAEKTMTEMAAEDHQETTEKPAAEKEAPKEPSGPKPAELLKTIMAKCSELSVGKIGLSKALRKLKYLTEEETLDKLDSKALAEIIDAWPEIADRIRNPDSPA